MSRVLYRSEDATASVIYLRWASPPTSIVLPSSACRQRQSDGPPSDAGLRGLSSSDVYSTTVASRLVSSYLTFSPLPPEWKTRHAGLRGVRRRLFSSTRISPRGLLPVRKRNALCCPDFPLPYEHLLTSKYRPLLLPQHQHEADTTAKQLKGRERPTEATDCPTASL